MNWHFLGSCFVVAECVCIFAFLVRINVRALRRLSASLLLALSLLAVGTSLDAQKTNNVPPNMNSPLPQMMQGPSFQTGLTGLLGIGNLINLVNPVQATIDDISRGWRVESVTTNAAVSYAMPTNATLVGNWHVHGAASSFGSNRIDFGDQRFELDADGTTRIRKFDYVLQQGTNLEFQVMEETR